MADPREPLGRIVRETWVAWAREQYRPKPSWLLLWEELDNGQREVDMRIGAAVAAAEQERIAALADKVEAVYDPDGYGVGVPFGDLIREPS